MGSMFNEIRESLHCSSDICSAITKLSVPGMKTIIENKVLFYEFTLDIDQFGCKDNFVKTTFNV